MGKTYRRPHQPILPKRSRTRPIFGRGDDEGRYYRCWNCGFVCDSQRDALGGSESDAGDNHTDYNGLAKSNPYLNSSDAGFKACLGGDIEHFQVAMELGPDDEERTIIHDLTSDVSHGCPFCGSTNWRGDY
jgi:predicted RNA-binding Zn-ribbon protein involved in translation (DUF1610 family)